MRTECLSARQHRCCNGNGALYSPINPTSFCAACSYVTLMLTRCAALRDGPGTPHHSNQLALYTALRLQPLLMSPRDKPPAIGSPAVPARVPALHAPCQVPAGGAELVCPACPGVSRCVPVRPSSSGCAGTVGPRHCLARRCDHAARLT